MVNLGAYIPCMDPMRMEVKSHQLGKVGAPCHSACFGVNKNPITRVFSAIYRVDIHNSIYNDRRGPPCKEPQSDVAHPTSHELFYRLDLMGKRMATLKNPKSNKFTKRVVLFYHPKFNQPRTLGLTKLAK